MTKGIPNNKGATAIAVTPSQSGSFLRLCEKNAKHFRGGVRGTEWGWGVVRSGGDPPRADARIFIAFGGTAEAVPFPIP